MAGGAALAEAFIEINPRIAANFESQMRRQLTGTLEKSGREAGAKAGTETGKQFSKTLGDSLAGLGAFVAARRVGQFFSSAKDAALEFETAFAGVRKTVEGTDAELSVIEGSFRRLAKELPFTATEIANVGEAAGQLGIAKDDLVDFTRVALEIGETTDISAAQAATSFAQLTNILGISTDAVDSLSSGLVGLGAQGEATESGILELALRIGSAGRAIGLSSDEVLGFAAGMKNLAIEAEAGGTAISTVFLEIQKAVDLGGKELEVFARTAGLAPTEFARAFKEDASEAVLLFLQGLRRIQDEGGNTTVVLDDLGLADRRVSDTIRRLSGDVDGLRGTLALSATEIEKNTARQDEFAKRMDTSAAQLKILSNRFNDAKISIGGVIAAGLIPLLEIATRIPAPLIAAGAALAGIAAAGIAFVKIRTVLADVGAELRSMGTLGTRAASGIGLLGKALAGITIASLVGSGIEKLTEQINELVRGAPNVDAVTQSLIGLADGTANVSNVLSKSNLGRDVEDLAGDINRATTGVTGGFGKLVSVIPGMTSELEFLRQDFDAIDKALAALAAGGAPDQAKAAFDRLSAALELTPAQASKILDDYAQSSAGAATSATISAAASKEQGDAIDGLEEPVTETKDAFEELTDALDEYGKKLDRTLRLTGDTRAAEAAFQEAIDDVAESLKENGRSLDLNTEKGRNNSRAVGDLIDSLDELVQQRVKEGQVSSDAASIEAEYGRQLDILARKFPNLRDEIFLYQTSLLGVPPRVVTEVQAPGLRDSLNRLIEFRDVLGDVGGVRIRIDGRPLPGRAHSGGWIGAPGSSNREVLKILEQGEFVVNRRAARIYGPLLERLNRSVALPSASRFPRMHEGGVVGNGSAIVNVELAPVVAAIQRLEARLDAMRPINVTEVAQDPEATARAVADRVGVIATR